MSLGGNNFRIAIWRAADVPRGDGSPRGLESEATRGIPRAQGRRAMSWIAVMTILILLAGAAPDIAATRTVEYTSGTGTAASYLPQTWTF